MHEYDAIFAFPGAVLNCWFCGKRGVLHDGGPFMICHVCDVMWTRWERPVSIVTYKPMYEAA